MSNYEEIDEVWRAIGLAAPARKALVDAKLYKVSDLRKISLEELTNLHGMGKSTLPKLQKLLTDNDLSFKL